MNSQTRTTPFSLLEMNVDAGVPTSKRCSHPMEGATR